jgi:hypothetical protein
MRNAATPPTNVPITVTGSGTGVAVLAYPNPKPKLGRARTLGNGLSPGIENVTELILELEVKPTNVWLPLTICEEPSASEIVKLVEKDGGKFAWRALKLAPTAVMPSGRKAEIDLSPPMAAPVDAK